MHCTVIVRCEAEDRFVAHPLGLPELEAIRRRLARLARQLAPGAGARASVWLIRRRVARTKKAQAERAHTGTKLWRRFQKLESVPPAERKPIIQLLDAFLARARTE
jgi:hypothetical protein